MIMTGLLLVLLSVPAPDLPVGYGEASWGISVEQLQELTKVHKASPGSGYSYADHAETNPDVYVARTNGKRLEYYFFQKKLYKIYIVYDRGADDDTFYRKLIEQHVERFGEPHEQYQEKVFGLSVKHTLWRNAVSTFDLRNGAGYIYQVRINRKAAAAKRLLQQFRHSI